MEHSHVLCLVYRKLHGWDFADHPRSSRIFLLFSHFFTSLVGSGFSGDEYLGGNRVTIGGMDCPLDLFFTTAHRLVCIVPEHPNYPTQIPPRSDYSPNDVWETVRVLVDGAYATNDQAFRFSMWHTPLLQQMTHTSVAGSTMSFTG